MNVAFRPDVRAKLIDPPVKVTREALEAKDAKIASLTQTIRVHEDMQRQNKAIVEGLKQQLAEARNAEEQLRGELRLVKRRLPKKGKVGAKAVVEEVLERFPHLTLAHVTNGRRKAEDIVAARHSCIMALTEQIPDMSYRAIADFLNVNECTIRYALQEGKLARGVY